MKVMIKDKFQTIFWAIIMVLLLGVCIHTFCSLSYNLESLYDEGYFYTHIVYAPSSTAAHTPPATTRPLSLAVNALNVLIPNVDKCDVLTLRRIAFCSKSTAILFLILSSCFYIYKRFKEKRLYPYLALVSCCLIVGTWKLWSMVFTWDDFIFILVTLIFSLCLIWSAVSQRIAKYVLTIIIGVVALWLLLANLPAGCMVTALCFLFLVLDNGWDITHCIYTALLGLAGMVLGLVITHFSVITVQDIWCFIHDNFINATHSASGSSHSVMYLILVILFSIRDLIITTLMLCGITYGGYLCQKIFSKSWLTIGLALVLYFIVWKWQVKPQMTVSAVMCWFSIMFLHYHARNNSISKRDVILVLFCLLLPLVAVFGTNVSIIRKATSCAASWGFLLFFFYYSARPEVRKYAFAGLLVILFPIIAGIRGYFSESQNDIHFDKAPTPISRMHLNEDQKAFYDEVYDVLADNGYEAGRDTLLGFCFNEMTVVAMGAMPYTNDAYPEELLTHDLENLPKCNYMILSEWDSVVLYNRLSQLDWDFPEAYTYYKCQNHPDPNAGFNNTQSMIYCRK